MRLSVLVPTISARASTLSRALWYLQQQSGEFEVIVHEGDTIGKGSKVNAMVDACDGDYIIVLDDDDYLPLNYMERVLPVLKADWDFVGYRILALRDGKFWLSIAHDAKNEFGNQSLNRGVCDKMPIRTALARQVRYGDEYTDDWPWSFEIHRRVESYTFIDAHLYVYDWWPESMAFKNNALETGDWSPQQDFGVWPFDREAIRWL